MERPCVSVGWQDVEGGVGSGTGHAQHTATPAVPVRTLRRSRSSGSLSACRPEPSLLPSRTHRSEGRAFSSAFKTKPHKNIRRQGVGGGLWAVKGAPREKSRRVYRLTVEARVRAGPGSATQPRERARVPHPHRGSRQAAGRRPLACPPYTPLWGRVSPVSPGTPVLATVRGPDDQNRASTQRSTLRS